MKIRQLPDVLANKIAAGEVVERPASVVKELLENSIDANSTSIKINLQEAGLTEIKVTDNGDGMEAEDCKRSFLRHATSKIYYDQDLFHIRSLGFRGEALASIAAVSKMTIQTSTGKEAGTSLSLEAGHIMDSGKTSARKGTEVKVSELFYNTPARLKYMKTIYTELGHITDLVNRYALAHPRIRFHVIHDGKTIFATPGSGNQLQVIQKIYGMQVAQHMLFIQGSSLDFHVEGYIARPNYTRANRNYITLIVNGRYVKNFALTHAIVRAYDTLLMINRFPIVVLSIELDPILVDVNVHPTKLEVRFSKEKELMELLEQLIHDALRQVNLIPTITQPSKEKQTVQDQPAFPMEEHDQSKYVSDTVADEPERDVHHRPPDFPVNQVAEPTRQVEQESQQDENKTRHNHISSVDSLSPRVPNLYPIGQLQGTYILAQNELGFYMIDQHAAQERIKYEFYKNKLAQPTDDLQHLLLPLTFEFTTNESMFVQNHLGELEDIGLYVEPFGENTYAVRAHPSWFPKGEEETIIRDMVEQIIQEGTINIKEIREEVAALMSCKKSIKANHYLSEVDMSRLLNDLRYTEDPFTCPHGRPVIIHMTYYEIEKMFKRIQ